MTRSGGSHGLLQPAGIAHAAQKIDNPMHSWAGTVSNHAPSANKRGNFSDEKFPLFYEVAFFA